MSWLWEAQTTIHYIEGINQAYSSYQKDRGYNREYSHSCKKRRITHYTTNEDCRDGICKNESTLLCREYAHFSTAN